MRGDNVYEISEQLKRYKLNPWLDMEQIPPGRWFQDVIQQAVYKVKSAAIIIGKEGIGRWEKVELQTFISCCVNENMPVIPVLLSGLDALPPELPFLEQFVWVSFSKNVDEKEAIHNLAWGITGEKPRNE